MRLIKSPNRWSCLLASAAMLLDTELKDLVDEIGHDGSEIIWPDSKEPFCRRAFHIAEIIELFDKRGFCLTPIECLPRSVPTIDAEPFLVAFEANYQRIIRHMLAPGILVGYGPNGNPHAAAWNTIRVYDPMGDIYVRDDFTIRTFWKMLTIRAVSK